MALSNFNHTENVTSKLALPEAFLSGIQRHIREFRADRKAHRSLYSHHTKNAAKLAQAQRNINKVWY